MQFRELMGQPEAVQSIRDAVSHNRLAHALLLTGPSGIGKLAFAHAIAQYINCLSPKDGDSCGTCSSCVKIQKGIHPDIRFILPIISKTEGGKRFLTDDYFDSFRQPFFADPYFSMGQWQQILGGDSKQLMISVHEIRELKRSIYLKAFEAKYKVVIVWNVEKINTEGSNAFLKLLEEPPDQTMFILTCSDPSLLLPTINSRCQRLALRRIDRDLVRQYLMEKKGADEGRATELAAVSEGSIGTASDMLQENSQALGQLYINWLRATYSGDYQKITEEVEKIYKESKEAQKQFLHVSMQKLRDSLLFNLGMGERSLAMPDEQVFHSRFSQFVSPDKVERIAGEMEESLRHISGNANPQMVFTSLSLKMYGILRGS
ncbi:MAG: DNA polymerase III subunit delta' [Bacteroidetes bacterium]|nr:MAG: DNA polymerase III subunit delta' [Bacteroidota bacterium]